MPFEAPFLRVDAIPFWYYRILYFKEFKTYISRRDAIMEASRNCQALENYSRVISNHNAN